MALRTLVGPHGAMATHLPKVSVIIPVYKAEAYIDRCIQSLRAQSLKELEFIFVDDCGQDESMAIVKCHAAEDARIRILHNQANLGPGPSRNAGMAVAHGEYLNFVDPDDWVTEDFYALLYARAIEGDYDIVKGALYNVTETEMGTKKCRLEPQNRRIARELRSCWALYASFTSQHTTAIYRRSMLAAANARYGDSHNTEDVVFLLRACHAARSFAIEDRAAYYYFQRHGSAMHRHDRARYDAELTSLTEMIDFLSAHESEGRDIYRYAAWMLVCYLRRNLEIRRNPALKGYAREHWREVRRQVNRLPNQWLLARFVVRTPWRAAAHVMDVLAHNMGVFFHNRRNPEHADREG